MPYTGTVQAVTFITRNPSLTREEFYKYWANVHAPLVAPWVIITSVLIILSSTHSTDLYPQAEKHGVICYRQHHKAGRMVPNMSDDSQPGVSPERDDLPKEMVEYDGFVVWELPNLEMWHTAFKDPYYVQVIEPDEHNLIDKNSFAGGIVSTFSGPVFQAMKDGKSSITGADADEYRRKFEEFEAKQKAS